MLSGSLSGSCLFGTEWQCVFGRSSRKFNSRGCELEWGTRIIDNRRKLSGFDTNFFRRCGVVSVRRRRIFVRSHSGVFCGWRFFCNIGCFSAILSRHCNELSRERRVGRVADFRRILGRRRLIGRTGFFVE